MIVLDSSIWIEHLKSKPATGKISHYFKNIQEVITPTIAIYEVFKRMKKEHSVQETYDLVAQMLKTNVVPITADIAMTAANVSLEHDLPMADSLVYATAVEYDCKVVTLDNDFRDLPRAEVIRS